MRHSIICILIFAIGLLLSSCSNTCENLDCISSNYHGQFKVIKATDGKDLVFGPNKIYDKSKIKFYSLNDGDTIFFEYQANKDLNTQLDSVLSVTFSPKADIAYMKLSNSDIDTINITYKIFNSECCGTINEITKIIVNNDVSNTENKDIVKIKK